MSTEPETPADDETVEGGQQLELSANSAYAHGLRAGLVAALDDSSGFQDRDLYDTFGWPEDPSEEELFVLGLRNAVAWTVINKPAFTTWRDNPEIVDEADADSTEFEQAARKLEDIDAWSYAERIDRLAGFGEHGVLVIGFSDTSGPDGLADPVDEDVVSGLDDIRNIRVYPQIAIEDIDWGRPGTERWGEPVKYEIDLGDDTDDSADDESGTITVHHSRVIDVPATRLLDDETLARPRIEPCLNNIIDIEKTLGSAAEQSYRGADYGIAANFDPEKVSTSDQDMEFVNDEMQDWYHGLQPFMRLVGADEIKTLGGEMQDPTGIIDNELSMVSMHTGIPKNELEGNRQGEVSGSEEDKKSYFGMIRERREQYATPHIVRALVDRLRNLGILPEPAGGSYSVEWPDLHELSESDEADIQAKRAQAAQQLQQVIPGRSGGDWEHFVETGEFRERDSETVESNIDEGDPRVQEYFRRSFTANDWNPELHPRDGEGKFTEKPGVAGALDTARDKFTSATKTVSIGGQSVEASPVVRDAYSRDLSAVRKASHEELENRLPEEEFGVEAMEEMGAGWREAQVSLLNSTTRHIWATAADETGNDKFPESSRLSSPNADGYERDVVLEQKQFTEETLRDIFGDTVPVARGVEGDFAEQIKEAKENGEEVEIEPRTLESWSTFPDHARKFAERETGDGVLITQEIPVEEIWMSSHTTPGIAEEENEIVAGRGDSYTVSPEDIYEPNEEDMTQLYNRMREHVAGGS